MIIVRIIGGLGNQMFQYAFYKNLKEKYKNVKCDIIGYENYKLHNGFDIENNFDVKIDIATFAEIEKCTIFYNRNIFSRIMRKFFGNKNSHIHEVNFDEKRFAFEDSFYLDGYWQSEQFFGNRENLRDDFKFKGLPQDSALISSITSSNSVSLHVRRGDYVGNSVYIQTNEAYYADAMHYLADNIDNAIFYVFSDDLVWAETQLLQPYKSKFSLVFPLNGGASAIDDLQMMSLCKHNIIANSSFSWWAAWLNNNNNKTIVYPKKWYNDTAFNQAHLDKMPEKWLAI